MKIKQLSLLVLVVVFVIVCGCTILGRNQGASPSPPPAATVTAGADASAPDSIQLTPSPGKLLTGGKSSIIKAQLLLGGQPCACSGHTIFFIVDNPEVGYLPWVFSNITDSSGQSCILLTSGRLAGTVKVTGYSMVGARNLSGNCIVQVAGN